MSELKVALLCSSRFAIPAMRDMIFHKQLAVIVIPEHCTDFIEETALLLTGTKVPVVQLNKQTLQSVLQKIIKQYNINVAFVMSFSFKIPEAVCTMVSKGFFNVHPGPLPEYRGADPVFQQIKNREEKAGVTIHKLVEQIDAGDIVIKEMIKTDLNDTYGLLNNKLSELASRMVGTVNKMIGLDITIPARPQDESKAQYFARQTNNDVIIDWDDMNAGEIIALINACNPWNKGAVTKLNYKIIRVLSAEKVEPEYEGNEDVMPGTILSIDDKGILISLINNSRLRITYIYTDEGFMHASAITLLGFSTGSKFLNMYV